MKEALKKASGMFLIDIAFLCMLFISRVREEGTAIILIGSCLFIMTVLNIMKNYRNKETLPMKAFYYIGIILASLGFIMIFLKKLL